jgi:hypothetical protein
MKISLASPRFLCYHADMPKKPSKSKETWDAICEAFKSRPVSQNADDFCTVYGVSLSPLYREINKRKPANPQPTEEKTTK